MSNFSCNGCGECCKAIKCEHLDLNNRCKIYETRPLVCRVDDAYEIFFRDKLTKVEWHNLNHSACLELQRNSK